jgi:hypothetical protein
MKQGRTCSPSSLIIPDLAADTFATWVALIAVRLRCRCAMCRGAWRDVRDALLNYALGQAGSRSTCHRAGVRRCAAV